MNGQALLRWVIEAARAFGWRDMALAAGLIVFFLTFSNSGGYLLISLTEGTNPIFDPAKTYGKTLFTGLLGRSLPLVFTIRVAERAIADGVQPWRAYLVALLVTLACSQAVLHLPMGTLNRSTQHIGRQLWFLLAFGIQLGTAVVLYALWRSSQRTTQRVRASEATRARDLQRLRSGELLALQARVDPQLLFDALGRVGVLQRTDPSAADRLLTDLIALLRAMLPRWAAAGSTVEREFTVVRAWLQVTRALTRDPPRVDVALDAHSGGAALAPMLVLPMLRAVLDTPGDAPVAWRLHAAAAGGRLLIELAGDAPRELGRAELAAMRDRLAQLHGDAARLWIAASPPRLTLDLPLTEAATTDATLGRPVACPLP